MLHLLLIDNLIETYDSSELSLLEMQDFLDHEWEAMNMLASGLEKPMHEALSLTIYNFFEYSDQTNLMKGQLLTVSISVLYEKPVFQSSTEHCADDLFLERQEARAWACPLDQLAHRPQISKITLECVSVILLDFRQYCIFEIRAQSRVGDSVRMSERICEGLSPLDGKLGKDSQNH